MERDKVFLSRRNVLTLLSKLQRHAAGEWTALTLIKNDDQHSVYPQTMPSCVVKADATETWYEADHFGHEVCLSKSTLEWLRDSLSPTASVGGMYSIAAPECAIDVTIVADDVYYADREAGPVHPSDTPQEQNDGY